MLRNIQARSTEQYFSIGFIIHAGVHIIRTFLLKVKYCCIAQGQVLLYRQLLAKLLYASVKSAVFTTPWLGEANLKLVILHFQLPL